MKITERMKALLPYWLGAYRMNLKKLVRNTILCNNHSIDGNAYTQKQRGCTYPDKHDNYLYVYGVRIQIELVSVQYLICFPVWRSYPVTVENI